MTAQESLALQQQMITKAREVAKQMGPNITPIEAALAALETWKPPAPDSLETFCPDAALLSAHGLDRCQHGFELDELIDQLIEESALDPRFRGTRRIKVRLGKLLRASGFVRKQQRRGEERPVIWCSSDLAPQVFRNPPSSE